MRFTYYASVLEQEVGWFYRLVVVHVHVYTHTLSAKVISNIQEMRIHGNLNYAHITFRPDPPAWLHNPTQAVLTMQMSSLV